MRPQLLAAPRAARTAAPSIAPVALFCVLLAPAASLALPGEQALDTPRAPDSLSSRPEAGDDWVDPHATLPLLRGNDPSGGFPPMDALPPCGGEVPCPCGGLVVADYTLKHDLVGCDGIGLVIGEDGLVLDCAGLAVEGIGVGTGIWIPSAKGVVIRNCDLRAFRIGLFAQDAERLAVRGNRFLENRVAAIWAESSRRLAIENNYFEENGRVGIGQRIGAIATLYATDDSRIEGSTAVHNGNANAYVGGIVLFDSARDSIIQNSLADTGEDNIWIRFGAGRHLVSRNTIVDSKMDGIWIRESEGNVVEDNVLSDIDLYGIFVRSANGNRIAGNRIERAGRRAHSGIGIGGNESLSNSNCVAGNEVRESLEGLSIGERAFDNLFLDNLLAGNRTGILAGYGRFGDPNEVRGTRIEGSTFRDVRMLGDRSTLYLVSSVFDPDLIDLVCFGVDCRIVVRWRIDLDVRSESGEPIGGASIVLLNRNGAEVFSGATGDDGRVDSIYATDYVLDEHGRTEFNDHILLVSKEGFAARELPLSIACDTSRAVVLAADPATGIDGAAPGVLALSLDIAPNPIGGSSTIRFALPEEARVRLEIFDVRGRLAGTLLDGPLASGAHSVSWGEIEGLGSAGAMPSGTYFVRLRAGERAIARKVVIAGS